MSIFSGLLKLFTDREALQEMKAPAEERFALQVEYLPMHRVIRIVTSGPLTVEANNQIVSAVLAAVEQYNTNLILVDDRLATLKVDIIRIYDLPEHNRRKGVKQDFKVALLFADSGRNAELFRFYENRVALNAFNQKVFSDELAAIAWLTDAIENS